MCERTDRRHRRHAEDDALAIVGRDSTPASRRRSCSTGQRGMTVPRQRFECGDAFSSPSSSWGEIMKGISGW